MNNETKNTLEDDLELVSNETPIARKRPANTGKKKSRAERKEINKRRRDARRTKSKK